MFDWLADVMQKLRRQSLLAKLGLLPKLSADEQTRASWPKRIATPEDVPDAYVDFFAPFARDTFPYTMLTPAYASFMRKADEKIICDLGDEICVLVKAEDTYVPYCYALDQISYVEIRVVLLDAHFLISGATQSGAFAPVLLKFNSIGEVLFESFLRRIRLAGVYAESPVQGAQRKTFNVWADRSYKFMNYAKRSLMGGEQVLCALFQPEVRQPVLTILGRTYSRRIAPAQATILTSRELIVIQEEPGRGDGDDNYGAIWRYIPLRKIASLSVGDHERAALRVLSIHLTDGVCLECLFDTSMEHDLERLLDDYRKFVSSTAA